MDVQAALPVAVPAVSFFLGLFFGRAWLMLLPVLAWAVFFTGYELGAWGYGYAEGWTFAFVLFSLMGMAAAYIGQVLNGHLARRSQDPDAET